MGRRVYENDEFVWKYVFAEQDSEQCRIANDLNIGKITYHGDYDCLTLSISDVEKLEKVLEEATDYKAANEEYNRLLEPYEKGVPYEDYKRINQRARELCYDIYFYQMIEAYIKYMKKTYEEEQREEFKFIGEY